MAFKKLNEAYKDILTLLYKRNQVGISYCIALCIFFQRIEKQQQKQETSRSNTSKVSDHLSSPVVKMTED